MAKIIKTIFGFVCVAVLLATPPMLNAYGNDTDNIMDASVQTDAGLMSDIDTDIQNTEGALNNSEKEPTISELIEDSKTIVNDWRALGAIFGVIALLQLFVKLLKIKIVNDYMAAKKIKWTKPYISAALGAVIVGLTTYTAGGDIANSIVTGLLMGTTATGWNEMLNKFKQTKRQS